MASSGTFTEEARNRTGRNTHVRGYFTLTGTNTAGGFAVTASTFGLGRLDDVVMNGGVLAGTGGTAGVVATYDKTAGTITFLEAGSTNTALRESQNALTNYIARVTAVGA